MSVVDTLWNSRVWTGRGFDYRSEVVDLVRELEEECATRGLTLSKWVTNGGHGFVQTITYAAHTGQRPTQSRHLPANSLVVWLNHAEGTTKRCQAYRQLTRLLEQVKGRAIM